MEPLEPWNTARVWLDYQTGGAKHSIMLRTAQNIQSSVVLEVFDAMLTAMSSSLFQWDILGARIASAGSNVSLPLTWTGSATYGAGSGAGVNTPRQVTVIGRTVLGRRWSMQLYGVNENPPATYRAATIAVPNLAAGLAELQAAFDEVVICGIDAAPVNLYDYVNFNYNDHWVKEARK
jgi:hypothetical protein